MTTIPITLLTGFLGSGKTTFLNKLVRKASFSGAFIILNERGEVALDHALAENAPDKTVQLTGGCVCCSARSDLIDALRSLFQRRVRGQVAAFDRIIVELSADADPAAIMDSLRSDAIVAARYRIGETIAVIDATRGVDDLPASALSADRFILSKVDVAKRENVRRLREHLQRGTGPRQLLIADMGEDQ